MRVYSVWANQFSVYGTQKPVHCTQISVYATQKIFANFLQNVEFSCGTKISTHFKGSDGEIAFLKFHFVLELIIHNFYIIMSRRKWNFKKAISPSEPLKCVGILVLGSK